VESADVAAVLFSELLHAAIKTATIIADRKMFVLIIIPV